MASCTKGYQHFDNLYQGVPSHWQLVPSCTNLYKLSSGQCVLVMKGNTKYLHVHETFSVETNILICVIAHSVI